MATFKRGHVVTPAVCPRLFEVLTTLTLGALRNNHTVSTAFENIVQKKKKKQGRLVVHVPPAFFHDLSKNTTEIGREVRQDALAVMW